MNFPGKTAIVTGGSRGIGQACVLAFARAGWQVAFSYHTPGGTGRAACGTGPAARGRGGLLAGGCTDSSQVDRLFARAEEAFDP